MKLTLRRRFSQPLRSDLDGGRMAWLLFATCCWGRRALLILEVSRCGTVATEDCLDCLGLRTLLEG